ncbi:MAG: S49 family peptidase [Chlamydiales bacterium]|nr:S49 family peptidase [Chlamydiales bacterium]
MTNKAHSLFLTSIRSFFIALFSMTGISFGIIPLMIILGLLFSGSSSEPDRDYNVTILSNAEGVRKVQSKKAPVILQLNIEGLIGTNKLNKEKVAQQLIESREGDLSNDRVKAMLVNLNTPGGTVVDSDGIYRAILAYKKRYNVPVYAYVDGLCASGGMYIASAADKIYTSDISLVGSVGVLSPAFLNFSKLMETVGIQAKTLYEGKGKDDMNPLRPWKPGETEFFEKIIKYYYDHFVNVVINARPEIGKEKLIETYGAQVFPAPAAKENGYTDGAEYSRDQVLRMLLQEIGIEDDYYQVVTLEEEKWLNKLFEESFNFLQGGVKHRFDLGPLSDPEFSGQFLYLYQPEQ